MQNQSSDPNTPDRSEFRFPGDEALAALAAVFVRACKDQPEHTGFPTRTDMLEALDAVYLHCRNLEHPPIQAMQMLTWVRQMATKS